MKILNSPQRRYAKLKKRYLKVVNEYTELRLLAAEKPLLSEKEFQKIEARVAKLNDEMDGIMQELAQFKPLRGGV